MNPQTWLTSVALTLGVAFGAHWDDETFLGRGPMGLVGVAVPIGQHLSAEGEVGLATHRRDSGYLVAEGKPFTATGRLSYAFTNRDARVRPFVSAGASWMRSTVHFTSTHLVMGPDGRPIDGPTERSDWKVNLGAWEVGTGVEFKATDRLRWRPEARWMLTTSDPSFKPGYLEPPIWVIRGGVTFLWR
jgi:opacity protein-like surface antigen